MKKDKFIFNLMTETRWYFVAVIISAIIADKDLDGDSIIGER